MGNVVRLGDSVSCGDHAATGASDVFANSLPVVTEEFNTTTGHGCYPSTIFTGAWSTSVFVNGYPVALLNITNIRPHRCGHSTHGGVASTASPDVSIES